ncbi:MULTISPECIES: ABC transporter ATP-binding protein [Streptomyces]|jgi:putative ABC transport system ATP-binding protein|uniref:ABC transporter ATP-binding protein n=2 Tax=Streptomyces TaxID=1883 RepID=A0A652KWQ2_9ACTN|nr:MULTISPECIES: ABC transporter ATP-binding protein [unclassified Streptomyces]WSS71737.1 ABC transporter ATP-binding protein [Streptomyces sp. NBC_01175]WSS78742.1 ABC transporter ATP-binding protein [Streptomyces sp. NBC_01174]MDX3325605.1 ABC transporter ATP-binding protein [Streptomyces sp. ME02-6979-3A]MDX3430683.1 ABC transporter ATP-binding protein [Streptomyces sp. ME01-18a]TXS27894.1 ABC transporter ATP-binding protein [Streptomyces sp. gb1(2016)]
MTVPATGPRTASDIAAGAGLQLLEVTLTLGDGDTAVTALDQVSLQVAPGEFVAVVGPSGSGKSSLLAVAGGLQRPTSGTVDIAGTELTTLSDKQRTAARRRHIGFVFQQSNLLSSLTVKEQLLLPLHIDGRLDATARARAAELIEAVGLSHRAGSRPHQLSGGERQRAGLARALMTSPAVLLVDEPTSALDRARSAEAVRLISEQTHERGTATVMVTHDTAIMDAADRVYEMVDGRLS